MASVESNRALPPPTSVRGFLPIHTCRQRVQALGSHYIFWNMLPRSCRSASPSGTCPGMTAKTGPPSNPDCTGYFDVFLQRRSAIRGQTEQDQCARQNYEIGNISTPYSPVRHRGSPHLMMYSHHFNCDICPWHVFAVSLPGRCRGLRARCKPRIEKVVHLLQRIHP